MKDQHKRIKGYRDLSQGEIALMNEIKDHAAKTAILIHKVRSCRELECSMGQEITDEQYKESLRCLDIAKQRLQEGQMWFVRAVALPDSF